MQKLITLLKNTGCLTNLIIKLWQWLLTLYRPWQIKVYLKNHPIRKMQIGTGTGLNAMAGWLNTDLIPRTTKLVFLIAAIEYSAAVNMLREGFRTLKPGGKIRIIPRAWNNKFIYDFEVLRDVLTQVGYY